MAHMSAQRPKTGKTQYELPCVWVVQETVAVSMGFNGCHSRRARRGSSVASSKCRKGVVAVQVRPSPNNPRYPVRMYKSIRPVAYTSYDEGVVIVRRRGSGVSKCASWVYLDL
jgi:hypothetical protein